MSVYDKNHYNIVISLQLIKINEKNMFFFSIYPLNGSTNAHGAIWLCQALF